MQERLRFSEGLFLSDAMFQDNKNVWRFEIFKNFPEINVGVSDVSFGNLSFNWGEPERVICQREVFRKACGVDHQNIAVISCQHGKKCVEVDKNVPIGWLRAEESIACDCLLTNQKIALFLVVGDCAPVIIYDAKNNSIALVHSGWKSTGLNIVAEAVNCLQKRFNSSPKDLVVAIGPTICKNCYSFSRLPRERFEKWEKKYILKKKDNKGSAVFCVDLERKIVDQLLAVGVNEAKIETSKICTVENMSFFSHRRAEKTGQPESRFGILAEIK